MPPSPRARINWLDVFPRLTPWATGISPLRGCSMPPRMALSSQGERETDNVGKTWIANFRYDKLPPPAKPCEAQADGPETPSSKGNPECAGTNGGGAARAFSEAR